MCVCVCVCVCAGCFFVLLPCQKGLHTGLDVPELMSITIVVTVMTMLALEAYVQSQTSTYYGHVCDCTYASKAIVT